MNKHKLPLAFTMGDAAGIGPEIILKLFAQDLPHPAVVYGDAGVMEQYRHKLGLDLIIKPVKQITDIKPNQDLDSTNNTLYVINRWQDLPAITPGQVNKYAGMGAYEYLCQAIDDASAGQVQAIITAPLNKAAMHAAGIDFPGHTEILATRTNTTNYAMMLANNELRVLLVTIHIALSDVAKSITIPAELNAIRLAHKACLMANIQQPRIAVAGLNPHAGENGKFGPEEINIIQPAIEIARAEHINVSDALPGDTVFMRARQGEFDVVVAQYHDQGLIPIKYLGLDNGVNITVGLPFVRTSVDHGTAYDIAGQGIADPASLAAAMQLALDMSGAN